MYTLPPQLSPDLFEWGCATSSFQIEGASTLGGRVPSVWDDFCAQPGRILDASNGLTACDHYHRFASDVALIAQLGFKHYRFSIAWPRVMTANHQLNHEGLDFYKRLLDALEQHHITPNATLFHWDLPSHLPGGWLARDTAYRFADYAALLAQHLGDRLPRVATLNEPWCTAFLGHDVGVFAPGVQHRPSALLAAHHLMLGHGLAVQAWRSQRAGTQLGIVLNPELCDPAPSASPQARAANAQAAQMAEIERNDCFLNPLFGRPWPDALVQQIGLHGAARQEGDLQTIAQPLDFMGLNYYTRSVAQAPVNAAEKQRGYRFVPPAAHLSKTAIGWEIYPEGLGRMVRNLTRHWPLPPLWITENGAADNTPLANGQCHDTLRWHYLQTHLNEVAQLIAQGIDLRGYYAWSLLDNFEWAHGYSQRFGLVHVDFASQARTPKHSALKLQKLLLS